MSISSTSDSSAASAKRVSTAEFTERKVARTLTKTSDNRELNVNTEQFTATMFFNIFSMLKKDDFIGGINTKADEIAKDHEKKRISYRNDLVHSEYYNSQAFIDEFKQAAINILRKTFKGIEDIDYRIWVFCLKRAQNKHVNCFNSLLEGQSSEVELYRPNTGRDGFIANHIISIIFAVFRGIIRNTDNKYQAYCCIYGDVEYKVFLYNWDYTCALYYQSLLDEGRGNAKGLILISEIIEKAKEWLLAFTRTKTKPIPITQPDGSIIYIHSFINPGYFHFLISGVEYKAGKISPQIDPEAVKIVEQKKKWATQSSVLDENSEDSKRVESALEKLLDKYRKMKVSDEEAADFFGLPFPDLLEKIRNDFTKLYLDTVYPSNPSDSLKAMVENVIERAFVGYQAWSNDNYYNFLNVTSNVLEPIKLGTEKDDKREIPFDVVFPAVSPSARRSVYESKRLYPCFLTPELLEQLTLIKDLRFSYPIGKEENGTQHWGTSTIRVPITCLVDCYESSANNAKIIVHNATPNGICVFLYCRSDEAADTLRAQKGVVKIDGVNYMLLIYNPNFDYKVTNSSSVRGCWFLLAQGKNNQFEFFVLTRKVFEKYFGMDSINTIVAFKYYDQETKSFYIINYTYVTIPLPPLMRYEGKDSDGINYQLMNEYPRVLEYFKAHPEATNASFLRELDSMDPTSGEEFRVNLTASIFSFLETLGKKITEIPIHAKNFVKQEEVKQESANAQLIPYAFMQ